MEPASPIFRLGLGFLFKFSLSAQSLALSDLAAKIWSAALFSPASTGIASKARLSQYFLKRLEACSNLVFVGFITLYHAPLESTSIGSFLVLFLTGNPCNMFWYMFIKVSRVCSKLLVLSIKCFPKNWG